MEIHLSKPGGHKEGPYTLEQINRDLAEGKYTDTDFWAWHHGLTTWVPLHAINGIRSTPLSKTEPPAAPEPQPIETPKTTATPEPEPLQAASTDVIEPEPVVATPIATLESEPAAESTPVAASQPVEAASPVLESQPAEVTIATTPEPEPAVATPAAIAQPQPATAHPASTRTGTASLDEMAAEADAAEASHTGDTEVFSPEDGRDRPLTRAQVASGMPAQALEEIFVFTSGDGKVVMQSAVTDTVLENIVGEDLGSVRHIRRHVIGRCSLGERLRSEGTIPDAAWRAMSALKPGIVREAREGVYHACVRTFTVEENQVVALFLFYNKDVAAALAAVGRAAVTLPAAVA